MIRSTALVLTVFTGFSGLVYEVAWQKYLATMLGSHSEATAAVLGIFLGGLSVGYRLFGSVTRRVVARAVASGAAPRLLALYGILEAGIGAYVLAFPWIFKAILGLSYAIPHGPKGMGFVVDVILAAFLIGPASILMGGTIPILTQALARSLDDATRFHAFVYAFNTAGAFVGALAAGFYLIPRLGLVNVMLTMGMINLLAGCVFLVLGARGRPVEFVEPEEKTPVVQSFGYYAAVAACVGFSMMTIQTVIIRVAGLSFGSSEFTFSMVVAVFVLCIAIGSFAVSLLGTIPRSLLVVNQWGLALLFFGLYFLLPEAPYWVHILRTLFRDTSEAFPAYHVAGFQLLLAVIGIPVLLSGAALPLIFHQLRREVGELGGIAGNLYSWNTLGSLLGALLGGYALLYWLDLHHVYRLSVVVLLVAAVIVTFRVYSPSAVVALSLLPLIGAVVMLPRWDPRILTAGLFRRREADPGVYRGLDGYMAAHPGLFDVPILFVEDDPAMTVSVRQMTDEGGNVALVIATNGKVDGHTRGDYSTMALLAALPAMLADHPERAFVIGWGTGVTAGELASFESIREVEVAEISSGVIRAAPYFDGFNLSASSNPKVKIIQGDAYRTLMRAEDQYDVIVSEPSNPWVAGVEMVFSYEFLEVARSKLSPGGVYCQWFHTYEMDAASVALVFRTYIAVFDQVAVWESTDGDLLLLGFDDARAADHIFYRLQDRAARSDYKASLERSGIDGFASLLIHEIYPLGVLHAAGFTGALHTLYHPRLSHLAGRAFYRGQSADLPFTGFGEAARIGRRNSMLQNYMRLKGGTLERGEWTEIASEICMRSNSTSSMCNTYAARFTITEDKSVSKGAERDNVADAKAREALQLIDDLSRLYADGPRPEKAVSPGRAQQNSENFAKYYLHGVPFDPERLLEVWSNCREVPRSEAECRAQVAAGSARNTTGRASAQEQIGECRAELVPGPQCRAGFVRARQLLEGGRAVQ